MESLAELDGGKYTRGDRRFCYTIPSQEIHYFLSWNVTKGKSFPQYVGSFLRDLPIGHEHDDVWKKTNPKMFFWTRRRQFWQPCRKFFAQGAKTIIKSYFENFFSQNVPVDT